MGPPGPPKSSDKFPKSTKKYLILTIFVDFFRIFPDLLGGPGGPLGRLFLRFFGGFGGFGGSVDVRGDPKYKVEKCRFSKMQHELTKTLFSSFLGRLSRR